MTQHLKPRSATVVLYQGDDMDRLAELKRKVDLAERMLEQALADAADRPARVGDDAAENVVAAREAKAQSEAEFDAFVDEAAERALSIEIHTIGREFFRDLVAAHPPRLVPKPVAPPADGEDAPAPEMVEHEDDAGWGVNAETFPVALLTFRKMDEEGDEPELVTTIAQPEFKTEAKVKRFVNRELSEGDFDRLWQAAYLLNRTPTQDPKAFVHSMNGSPSTDET